MIHEFSSIPISFVQSVLSENEQSYICQIYNMLKDYKILKTENKNDNHIFIILAEKYNISVSGVKLIFWRKFKELKK